MKDASDPLFTVVICAHDRRTYLPDAIRSVLSQDYPREKFEIVLVKNFPDAEIDDLASGNGIKTILTSQIPLSGKIAEGITNSRGKYVCFLDDDDKFERNKLSRIALFLDRYDNVAFYHNSYSTMNEDGMLTERRISRRASSPTVYRGDKDISKGLPAMLHQRSDWYASMMCIRREEAARQLEFLWRTGASADRILFLAGLISGNTVVVDDARTTLYRMHRSLTTVISDFNDFIRRKAAFYGTSLGAVAIMSEMCRGSILERLASCSLTHAEVLSAFVGDVPSISILQYFLKVSRCLAVFRMWNVSIWFGMLVLKSIFGTPVLKAYYLFSTAFLRKSSA